jgi:hypothetical protein
VPGVLRMLEYRSWMTRLGLIVDELSLSGELDCEMSAASVGSSISLSMAEKV